MKRKMNKILMNEEFNHKKIDSNGNYILECKNAKEVKMEIDKNKEVTIYELKDNILSNKIYDFILFDESSLVINKFYNSKNIDEKINIYLNGIKSKVILNLSSISLEKNNFIINIYHNNRDTKSNTNIHCLQIEDSKVNIENNGFIKLDSKSSYLNQDNKIIVIGNNNSTIKPNLFIDEYDVNASHGAFIGKFNDEDLFYLKSRGLNSKEAYKLLLNGFLLNDDYFKEMISKKVKDIIDRR